MLLTILCRLGFISLLYIWENRKWRLRDGKQFLQGHIVGSVWQTKAVFLAPGWHLLTSPATVYTPCPVLPTCRTGRSHTQFPSVLPPVLKRRPSPDKEDPRECMNPHHCSNNNTTQPVSLMKKEFLPQLEAQNKVVGPIADLPKGKHSCWLQNIWI